MKAIGLKRFENEECYCTIKKNNFRHLMLSKKPCGRYSIRGKLVWLFVNFEYDI